MTGDDGSNDDTGWTTRRTALQTVAVGVGTTLGLGLGSGRARARAPGDVRWQDSVDLSGAPSAANGRVYIPTRGRLFALGQANAGGRWLYDTGDQPGGFADVVDTGETAYTNTFDGWFYALDTTDGKERWHYDPEQHGGDFVVLFDVGEGYVYVTVYGADADVYALDTRSGEVAWTGDDARETTGAYFADGVVYVGGPSRVRAYDAMTGDRRWEVELDLRARGNIHAVVSGTLVSAGERDGTVTVVARETADASERWTTELEEGTPMPPTIHDGAVYLPTREGTLYALDVTTGEERWRAALGGEMFDEPAVAAGTVYTCAGRFLYALDAGTGEEHWRFAVAPDAGDRSPPRALGPATGEAGVFVGSTDGVVYALDADTSTPTPTATPTPTPTPSPTATPTPTETATATDASTGGGDGGERTSDGEQTPAVSSGDGPGMGVGAGVLGALGLGYLLGRRDTEDGE